jgi:hypothetical protein
MLDRHSGDHDDTQPTGAVDLDLRSPDVKMDREAHGTDADLATDSDPRGAARQARKQQREARRQTLDAARKHA